MPFTTGYGWHRRPFWFWHFVSHKLNKIPNNYLSRLFCTYCADERQGYLK